MFRSDSFLSTKHHQLSDFSCTPYSVVGGGGGGGGITIGVGAGKWLYEVRTIHYIVVIPIGIFPCVCGGTL